MVETIAIDLHAHPGGKFGLARGRLALKIDEKRMDRRIGQMEGDSPSVSIVAMVPDAPTLRLARGGLRAAP